MLSASGHSVIGISRSRIDDFPGTQFSIDLGDIQATKSGMAEISKTFDIDGVINNVGYVGAQYLQDVDISTLHKVLSVNLDPAVTIVQAALPGMISRGWGRIVNISSLTALGAVQRTAYAAAKASLESFTRGWALELASTGVTVNCVAPGPTETELFRANNPPGSDGEKRYLSGVPIGRFGKPSEIAASISFLLSEEASFITGQTLRVDGGASIGKNLS